MDGKRARIYSDLCLAQASLLSRPTYILRALPACFPFQVGCCLVSLSGKQAVNDEAMWQRKEAHAWSLHLLVGCPSLQAALPTAA